MKVAIYSRVSTDKQSVEMQINDLKEYIKLRKFSLYGIFTDVASGTSKKRPEFDKLMNLAKKRKIDIVLVWRFDRFSRSTKELVTALDEFNSLGVQFISFQENIDTSSPSGKLIFSIFSAIAEFEKKIISERVKAGLRNAKKKGKVLGRPSVRLDEEKIKTLHLQGDSYRKIAKYFNVSHMTIKRICEGVERLNIK